MLCPLPLQRLLLLLLTYTQDGLSLWAYEEGERWWRLRNGNPLGTRLTSLQWINGDSVSRLAVGSDDGVVRVWSGVLEDGTYGGGGCGPKLGASSSSPKSRGGYSNDDYGENYDGNDGDTSAGENDYDGSDEGRSSSEWEPPRLLTSFAAAPEVAPGAAGAGLVTAYSETLLFAGGQLSRLRLWDLQVVSKCGSGGLDRLTSLFCPDKTGLVTVYLKRLISFFLFVLELAMASFVFVCFLLLTGREMRRAVACRSSE